MKSNLKLLIIAGARPNFMKVAPLIRRIRAGDWGKNGVGLDYRLVHTGQHYDEKMSGVFFQELGIPVPDINLEVGSGSHAVQTANIMTKFEPVCLAEKPDWVVVVGDVNSSVACALVDAKLGIQVAYENLRRESVADEKIKLVGNIMIDSLLENVEKARQSATLQRLGLEGRPFVYVTLHRPSNVDHKENLDVIISELTRLSHQLPVVFPMHPRTRKMLSQFGIPVEQFNGFKILDPIGYHDSLCLTERARFILTDSGGLQEESTFFRTPCLTLRPNTERPVTLTVGSNRLTSPAVLRSDIDHVLQSGARAGAVPHLWDGQTASRTLQAIVSASS